MGKTTLKCTLQQASAREALNVQLSRLKDLAGPLRHQDIEAVHDARVASRRLRAVLSEHKQLFEKEALKTAREKARLITAGLGKARELDVCIDDLTVLTGRIPEGEKRAERHFTNFLGRLRAAESGKLAEVADSIESQDFQESLSRLQRHLARPSRCYFSSASRRVTRMFDSVLAAAGAWKESGAPEHLHAIRIAFKKLRYECEIYRPLYGAPMEEFIDCLKDVQDCLGRWHDYSVLNRYLAEARAKARGETAKEYAAFSVRLAAETESLLDLFRRHAEVFFYPEQVKQFRLFLSGKIQDLRQQGGECKCSG